MSRFSQNWDKIFKNGLLYRVFPEFSYLGKLSTVCYDDVIKFSRVCTLYLYVPWKITWTGYGDDVIDHFRKKSIVFRDTRDHQEHDAKNRLSIPSPSPEKLVAEIGSFLALINNPRGSLSVAGRQLAHICPHYFEAIILCKNGPQWEIKPVY